MRQYTTVLALLFTVLLIGAAPSVSAHTVSNSYLTIESVAGQPGTFHAQWDISLRDLEFVVGLDDDGDGRITWGELKGHRKAIEKFAYARLDLAAGGKRCTLRPTKQWVDTHADGAYAVLFFSVHCPAKNAPELVLHDRLLFKIDPTHRGILVFRAGSDTATALLSPDRQRLKLKLPAKGG